MRKIIDFSILAVFLLFASVFQPYTDGPAVGTPSACSKDKPSFPFDPDKSVLPEPVALPMIQDLRVLGNRKLFFNIVDRGNGERLSFEQWLLDFRTYTSERIFEGEKINMTNPSFSADGKKAVFSESAGENSWIIKFVDVQEEQIKVLAQNSTLSYPRISQDGKKVAFITTIVGSEKKVLYVLPADHSAPGQFSDHSISWKMDGSWDWHPSSKAIAYSTRTEEGAYIFLRDIEKQKESIIIEDMDPSVRAYPEISFSPDGKKLFFVELKRTNSHYRKFPKILAPDNHISKSVKVPVGTYLSLSWSPDSERLAGGVIAEGEGSEKEILYFVWDENADTSQILFSDCFYEVSWLSNTELIFSDHKRIFILAFEGGKWREAKEIYRLCKEGGHPVKAPQKEGCKKGSPI